MALCLTRERIIPEITLQGPANFQTRELLPLTDPFLTKSMFRSKLKPLSSEVPLRYKRMRSIFLFLVEWAERY